MRTLIFFFAILIIKQCFCDDTIEISLNQGVVLGKVEKSLVKKQDFYSFRGIPFAEPPTGELRFQPPKPHDGWNGNLEAFDNKPTCMQFSSRMRNKEPFGISGSEDCLYISVYTPDVKGNAPVIVFDYNDQFRTWFNGTNTYSPDFLVEEGVIVVTISHRLAILGYLTTEDGVIKGNNGLRDFILGLEWVKDNIEKFGGDPSKVTLMGSRGGAALADILLYSEKAKGLFSAAILQSGTSLEAMYFYNNPKKKAFQLGGALNITAADSKELLQELQKIDAETLLRAEIDTIDNESFDEYQISSFPFAPTIEDDLEDGILTILPEKGKFVIDVPIIIGFNSREGLDLTTNLIAEPRLLTDETEQNILQFPIRTDFRFNRESSKYKEAGKEIVNFYLEDKSLHYGNILEYSEYMADALQNYAIDLAAHKMAESLSSPVFYYLFDFRGQWNENSQYISTISRYNLGPHGATVGDELCYLLVCSRIKKSYRQILSLASEQNEVKVAKRMVRMWSNFAKTRNPTPSKDVPILKGFVWKPISKEPDTNYLHVTKLLRMKTNPFGERKKFWNDFLDKYSKMAVDGFISDEPGHEEL
uniref:Carboxyl/choline esterase CCE021b n=1 Tax=Helicoverpa armigera TaxID=29058 RepID=D5G3F7_HELAM|nr:carboxyl/choline esterase CCE021b [Helicoverpa armigera]